MGAGEGGAWQSAAHFGRAIPKSPRGGDLGRDESSVSTPLRETEEEALRDLARFWAADAEREEAYDSGEIMRTGGGHLWPSRAARVSPGEPAMRERIARERARLEAEALGGAEAGKAEPGLRGRRL